MAENINKIKEALKPIREKKRTLDGLDQELTEAKSLLKKMEEEQSETPSFAKSVEITNLKNSYEGFRLEVQKIREDYEAMKVEIDGKIRGLANEEITSRANATIKPVLEEAEEEIKNAAKTITEAALRVRDTVSEALEEARNYVQDETSVEYYLDHGNDDRYPNYRNIKSKSLSNQMGEELMQIEKHFTEDRYW